MAKKGRRSRKGAAKKSAGSLQDAADLVAAAYDRLVEAETKIITFKAYSDVHGVSARVASVLRKLYESIRMQGVAKKK